MLSNANRPTDPSHGVGVSSEAAVTPIWLSPSRALHLWTSTGAPPLLPGRNFIFERVTHVVTCGWLLAVIEGEKVFSRHQQKEEDQEDEAQQKQIEKDPTPRSRR